MKKITALLLVVVMMISFVGTALADTNDNATPKYTLTELNYNGRNVTGKVVHDDSTPAAEKVRVRVTFFLEGNVYMATYRTCSADGSFEIMGVGPILYISVRAISVDSDGSTATLDAGEIVL